MARVWAYQSNSKLAAMASGEIKDNVGIRSPDTDAMTKLLYRAIAKTLNGMGATGADKGLTEGFILPDNYPNTATGLYSWLDHCDRLAVVTSRYSPKSWKLCQFLVLDNVPRLVLSSSVIVQVRRALWTCDNAEGRRAIMQELIKHNGVVKPGELMYMYLPRVDVKNLLSKVVPTDFSK